MSFLLHDPIMRPLDDDGAIMPLCYLQFYESETTTPTPIYADADLSTELDNPLVSNAAGVFPAIYGDTAVVYRRQLYDADDVLQNDTDPIHPHVQFPAGTVVFFNGDSTARDAAYPPALWEVCDGDGGTIDFRDRFPVGASATKTVGTTGGSSGTGTLTTSPDGAHDHGAVTGSTVADLAAHSHFSAINVSDTGGVLVSNTLPMCSASVAGTNSEYALRGQSGTPTVSPTSTAGSGGGHTHSVTSGGAHTHTVSVSATLPAWGALWMLQRKA